MKKNHQESKESKFQISMLINSIYYFLQSVFIMECENNYRLCVIHNNRVYTDSIYKTIRGARIAFEKLYHRKAWKQCIKAIWSHFYPPEKMWIEKKGIAAPGEGGEDLTEEFFYATIYQGVDLENLENEHNNTCCFK